ncbi:MAG: hypothetical protein GYB31_15350 [Bacteroidetes bacterium]|nr:hypothetical protein [Bacteroidota bacterium]
MKLQLSQKASDIFVIIYIFGTLFLRFQLESQLNGHILASVGLGAFALLFLWALNKSKYINPGWFGLLGTQNKAVSK